MTGLVPAMPPGQPSQADLVALIFRILYQNFDLHTVGVLYVVVPKVPAASPDPAWARSPARSAPRQHPRAALPAASGPARQE